MQNATILAAVQDKYIALLNDLDERGRRRWAATEVQALGYSGITLVAAATRAMIDAIRSTV